MSMNDACNLNNLWSAVMLCAYAEFVTAKAAAGGYKWPLEELFHFAERLDLQVELATQKGGAK